MAREGDLLIYIAQPEGQTPSSEADAIAAELIGKMCSRLAEMTNMTIGIPVSSKAFSDKAIYIVCLAEALYSSYPADVELDANALTFVYNEVVEKAFTLQHNESAWVKSQS